MCAVISEKSVSSKSVGCPYLKVRKRCLVRLHCIFDGGGRDFRPSNGPKAAPKAANDRMEFSLGSLGSTVLGNVIPADSNFGFRNQKRISVCCFKLGAGGNLLQWH